MSVRGAGQPGYIEIGVIQTISREKEARDGMGCDEVRMNPDDSETEPGLGTSA